MLIVYLEHRNTQFCCCNSVIEFKLGAKVAELRVWTPSETNTRNLSVLPAPTFLKFNSCKTTGTPFLYLTPWAKSSTAPVVNWTDILFWKKLLLESTLRIYLFSIGKTFYEVHPVPHLVIAHKTVITRTSKPVFFFNVASELLTFQL